MTLRRVIRIEWAPLALAGLLIAASLRAEDPPAPQKAPTAQAAEPDGDFGGAFGGAPAAPAEGEKDTPSPFGDPPGAIALSPKDKVWIDVKRKLVIVDGEVCMREGQLEMFACPRNSKEHESLVSVSAQPSVVHAGLLAVGATVGHPVRFEPEYKPAAGTEIEIMILWIDKEGKRHQDRAQSWIRQVKTQKEMPHSWVFAGSGFWADETTGQKHYYGDGGDFICVSNFTTATLDLPVPSSQTNTDLLFDAFTERIPPEKTKVRLVLIPKLEKKPAGGAPAPGDAAPEKEQDGDAVPKSE